MSGGVGRYSKCLICVISFDSDKNPIGAGSISFLFPVLWRRKQMLLARLTKLPQIPDQKVVELVSNPCYLKPALFTFMLYCLER